jgi:hypothetical protein
MTAIVLDRGEVQVNAAIIAAGLRLAPAPLRRASPQGEDDCGDDEERHHRAVDDPQGIRGFLLHGRPPGSLRGFRATRAPMPTVGRTRRFEQRRILTPAIGLVDGSSRGLRRDAPDRLEREFQVR